MPTYTLPYRVVYTGDNRIIGVVRGDIPRTHTVAGCAQFATLQELEEFMAAHGLQEPEKPA